MRNRLVISALPLLVSLLGVFIARGQEAMSAVTRSQLRSVFGYDPTPDFIDFDPQYRARRAKYYDELRDLQLELARQTEKGRATPCSRQIFLEARWLVL